MNHAKAITEFARARACEKIAICGHERPDPDSAASQFALKFLLERLGMRRVACAAQEPYPDTISPLLEGFSAIGCAEIGKGPVLVCADCSAVSRISEAARAALGEAELQIDHHAGNIGYAKINIVDECAAATSEIIAGLFMELGIKPDIKIARLLYAGIVGDSRSFSSPSTRAKTFAAAKWLAELGVETSEIFNIVLNSESMGKIRLQNALFEKAEFSRGGRLCIGLITQADIEKARAAESDKWGLADKMMSARGVEIAAIINETPGGLKVNMRARKVSARLNEIAESYGGGGHFEAAAFTAKTKDALALKKELERILGGRLSG